MASGFIGKSSASRSPGGVVRIGDHEQPAGDSIVAVIKYRLLHNSKEVKVTEAHVRTSFGSPPKESGTPIIDTDLIHCGSHVDEVLLDTDVISEAEHAPQDGLRLPFHEGTATLIQTRTSSGGARWVLQNRGEDDGER